MLKSKMLRGTVIIDRETGKIIGKITDTVFKPREKKIIGFSVCSGRWIKNERILTADCVDTIGRDVVLALHGCSLIDPDKDDEIKKAFDEKDKFIGIRVVTDKGDEIGFIEDIIINEKTCGIEGYLLTDGIIEDIISGKSVIPFSDHIIVGEGAVIIDNNDACIILKNDISLKKVFEKVKD